MGCPLNDSLVTTHNTCWNYTQYTSEAQEMEQSYEVYNIHYSHYSRQGGRVASVARSFMAAVQLNAGSPSRKKITVFRRKET